MFTWTPGADDAISVNPLAARSVFAQSGAPDALDTSIERLAETPVAIGAMLAELKRHRPFDLYIGHWFVPGGLVARVAGDAADRPSLVVGHSGGAHLLRRLPRALRDALQRQIVRRDSTTLPSSALAAHFPDTDVLPMGFHPTAAHAGGRGILLYGRLVDLKGFHVAAPFLRDREVHVVGDGPARKRTERLLPRATFWGFADAERKARAFALCDRALFPSRVRVSGRHEGWPVSVLEVSAAGVVPFVADWPGSDELVAVPHRQVVIDDDWGQATDADVGTLREAARAHADRFTWASLAHQWRTYVAAAAR